jgi:hypothetical protein
MGQQLPHSGPASTFLSPQPTLPPTDRVGPLRQAPSRTDRARPFSRPRSFSLPGRPQLSALLLLQPNREDDAAVTGTTSPRIFRPQLANSRSAPSGPVPLHLNSARPTLPAVVAADRVREEGRYAATSTPRARRQWVPGACPRASYHTIVRVSGELELCIVTGSHGLLIGALFRLGSAAVDARRGCRSTLGSCRSGSGMHGEVVRGEALSSRSVGAPLISHRSCDPVAEPCCIVDGRLRVTNPGEAFFRCYAMISSSRRFSAWRV